jgi:hypothetical protein
LAVGVVVFAGGSVAGWGSHPLESAAFSRRTREADVLDRGLPRPNWSDSGPLPRARHARLHPRRGRPPPNCRRPIPASPCRPGPASTGPTMRPSTSKIRVSSKACARRACRRGTRRRTESRRTGSRRYRRSSFLLARCDGVDDPLKSGERHVAAFPSVLSTGDDGLMSGLRPICQDCPCCEGGVATRGYLRLRSTSWGASTWRPGAMSS